MLMSPWSIFISNLCSYCIKQHCQLSPYIAAHCPVVSIVLLDTVWICVAVS